jgi:hypothetical protein
MNYEERFPEIEQIRTCYLHLQPLEDVVRVF